MVNKLCICWSEKLWYYRNARCYNKSPLSLLSSKSPSCPWSWWSCWQSWYVLTWSRVQFLAQGHGVPLGVFLVPRCQVSIYNQKILRDFSSPFVSLVATLKLNNIQYNVLADKMTLNKLTFLCLKGDITHALTVLWTALVRKGQQWLIWCCVNPLAY
jgi:hypothetical protein